MYKNTERFLKLFNQLHKEEQKSFILALEFSIACQKNTLKQIQQAYPEYELKLNSIFTNTQELVTTNG